MVDTLRTLIVDDEPPARERLKIMLADVPGVAIVGECGSGTAAIEAILALTPDLVLLDVQMPPPDGFAVLQSVAPTFMPAVIFVTAYDRYALQAFEVHALDYLLKPYDRARLLHAVHRAREQVALTRQGKVPQAVSGLLSGQRRASGFPQRFPVRDAERVTLVPVDEIEWVEAADNYVRLHTATGVHLMRGTMQDIEGELDPERFVRVGRSAIVNVAGIREIQHWFRGDYVILTNSGARLTTGRSFRARLRTLMGRAASP